jgi:hypothetical protein
MSKLEQFFDELTLRELALRKDTDKVLISNKDLMDYAYSTNNSRVVEVIASAIYHTTKERNNANK